MYSHTRTPNGTTQRILLLAMRFPELTCSVCVNAVVGRLPLAAASGHDEEGAGEQRDSTAETLWADFRSLRDSSYCGGLW